MNKKIFTLTSLVGVSLIAVTILGTVYKEKSIGFVTASSCSHVGYHYNAVAPTDDNPGHEEFWVCCKCHEIFLASPAGSFTTNDDSYMVGGLDKNHPAYLAPLKGGSNGDYYVSDPFDED